jgi:hypothetical protein
MTKQQIVKDYVLRYEKNYEEFVHNSRKEIS